MPGQAGKGGSVPVGGARIEPRRRADWLPCHPDLIKSGERGKYAKRYREDTNVLRIDPDLHRLFRDSESVNRSLRNTRKSNNMPLT